MPPANAARGEEDQDDRGRPGNLAGQAGNAVPRQIVIRAAAVIYGLRITRVAAEPVFFPCHSANAKAWLTSDSGKLCETSFESG